ncbi:MAG: thiolase family protein [Oscillospiraceae bacterium]|nr:thiolase family protein [Oscillospiraceae bacterium]
MKNIVIVDGVRTPFGRLGGGLKQFHTADLAAIATKKLIERTQIDPKEIDAVYMGSAKGDARCPNLARYTSLLAGLPYELSATGVEMQCGSAIAALNHAAYRIMAGDGDCIVVGGAETFSQLFFKFSTSQEPYKMTPPVAFENNLAPKAEDNLIMIQVADNMAKKWGITREECDAYALRSQMLTKQAMESGFLDNQVIDVVIPATKKTPEIVISKDEHPRPQTTAEALTKLKAIYEGGVTTAGNASGRNDGGAALLMMTEEKAKALGYTPIVRWVAGSDVGVDPKLMGIGPAYSNMKILDRLGMKPSDVGVYECNEAFAAQNLGVIRQMEIMSGETINMDSWNPNGGAISFGHPNGASGGRIAISAIRHMEKTGTQFGMISSCCGGGIGVSALFERI